MVEPKLTGDAIEPEPQAASRPVSEMIHVASYTVPEQPAMKKLSPPKPLTRPGVAVAKPSKAPPATKPVKTATADPLAPLSSVKPKAKGSAPGGPGPSPSRRISKDSDKD